MHSGVTPVSANSARIPELNPEERLNADLKHAITSKVPVRTKAKLRQAATNHMTMLEQTPQRVKKYGSAAIALIG
jgi:hypothetical protein